MELSVLNIEGKDTGTKVELQDSIFGIEPNDHAIYLDVKQHLANKRQGTHKSKEKWEVTASTKKIKRQKGTGTARAGSVKSPIFRGGGRVFGPKPRDYSFKLNKKVKRLARRSALTYKANNGQIIVVEDLNFAIPKTKDFIKLKNNLKVGNKKSLLVLSNQNKNVLLSSRNLSDSKVITVDELTTFDILNNFNLLLERGAIETINKLLGK